jgi:zinc protease
MLRMPSERYTLDNGLEIILVQDDRLPLVAANLRFHTGSGSDPRGRSGLAHLVEHLYAFSLPDDFPTMQGAGATQDGATTDPDRTTFYVTMPASQLELYLALESDTWRNFLQRADLRLLDRERSNVRNERRMVVENEPYGLADEAVFAQLFPDGYPYHRRYVGLHRDLEQISLEDAHAFFARYYVPGNASLVIAGDIDKGRVRGLIEKYFGTLAAQSPSKPADQMPRQVSPRAEMQRITVTDRVEQPRLTMAWVTPGWYEPGNAEAELLAVVLGTGASSRLQQRLITERRLAEGVAVEHLPFAGGSALVIKATPVSGITLQQLEAAIDQELNELRTSGPSAAELEKARNTVVLQIVRGLERLGEITAFGDSTGENAYGGIAEQLNQCAHFFGKPDCLPEVLSRYQAVTSATVRSFVEATLRPETRVIVQSLPGTKVVDDPPRVETPAPTSVAAHESAFVPPPVATASAMKAPALVRFELKNGLTVLVAERHQLPIVTVQLVMRGGSAASPLGIPGLAAFTLDMLSRGTTTRSASQMAADISRVGTTIESDISSDASALAFRVLEPNLGAALTLLADVTTQPSFPRAEMARVRDAQLARLEQLRTNADVRASYLFTHALYGPTSAYQGSGLFNDELFGRPHRYGYDEFGTEDSLRKLTRAEIVSFYRLVYRPENAALVLAGDLSPAEAQRLAEKYFGTWHSPSSPVSKSRASFVPDVRANRQLIVEDQGAASQTALRVGTLGAARDSADVVPLRMLNFIFGEIYASRITANLRETHGYTYMARSQFAFRNFPGPFVIGTNIRTDVTAPALTEIFNELNRIRTEEVPDEEMRFARNAYTGSIAAVFETTGKTATTVGQIFTYQLPLDHFQRLPAEIAKTTAADIERVAQRYLDPARMVVVAVGDRARIEPELKKVQP